MPIEPEQDDGKHEGAAVANPSIKIEKGERVATASSVKKRKGTVLEIEEDEDELDLIVVSKGVAIREVIDLTGL